MFIQDVRGSVLEEKNKRTTTPAFGSSPQMALKEIALKYYEGECRVLDLDIF